MLTSDLVRLKKRAGGGHVPRFIDHATRSRLLPLVTDLVSTYRTLVGRSREEVDEAVTRLSCPARDRKVFLGLVKLCDDGATFEQPGSLDPEGVRADVFGRAAKAHRENALDGFDRARVLADSATALGASVEDVERSLFADLRDAEVLRGFEALEPTALLDRYNVALAQSALLRATQVRVTVRDQDSTTVRAMFRAARFHGLIHLVQHADGGGYRITLDGPFSLFDAVQKYGLRLAMFLPSVLACSSFDLSADIKMSAGREPVELRLSHADGLVAWRSSPTEQRPEIAQLAAAFERLGADWDVAASDDVIAQPGEPVVVPDLVFTSRVTGEKVWLELFGFWSRAAVWRRVEQLQRGFPGRLIVAVSKKLRVSEEVLESREHGSIYVFSASMSAKEILARLEPR